MKVIIPELLDRKSTTTEIIENNNMKQISDETTINNIIKEVMESNKDFIQDNKDRPERVIKFLLGNIMKASKGQANPVVTDKLVKKALGV